MTMNGENSRRSLPQGRKFVALVGSGVGPLVAFRSETAKLRVCGLVLGGVVEIFIDGTSGLRVEDDGEFDIPGGQFAKVSGTNTKPLFCEILT